MLAVAATIGVLVLAAMLGTLLAGIWARVRFTEDELMDMGIDLGHAASRASKVRHPAALAWRRRTATEIRGIRNAIGLARPTDAELDAMSSLEMFRELERLHEMELEAGLFGRTAG